MNAPYEIANAMARSICGMPSDYRQAMKVVDNHRQTLAMQPIYHKVTFMGLDLYVGIDCYGDIDSVEADSDGTNVTEIFRDWSEEILKAIDVQRGGE